MRTHLELAQLFNTISNWDTIGTDTQYKILDYPDEVIIIFCPSSFRVRPEGCNIPIREGFPSSDQLY